MDLTKNWGDILLLDLYDCKPHLMKDTVRMKDFVRGLCNEIGMKRHKKPRIERFGEDKIEGYSMHQFIKTSGIEIHFEEHYGSQVMLTLFSCKPFDVKKVIDYAILIYGGKVLRKPILIKRGHK